MLINKRAVRNYTLGCAAGRSHKFRRVSQDFYTTCEGVLKDFIARHVHSLPSKGRTIK